MDKKLVMTIILLLSIQIMNVTAYALVDCNMSSTIPPTPTGAINTKILLVTDDKTSPLYTITNSIYDIVTTDKLPDNISLYNAIIIDNKSVTRLNTDILNPYVSSGGGLIVVGGYASYDKGLYNNSSFEDILPVISRNTEYKGGRNLIILIDASESTTLRNTATDYTFIDFISANAIKIIREISSDSNVAVLTFGEYETKQTGLVSMNDHVDRTDLERFVRDIIPKIGYGSTTLDIGLKSSGKLLETVTGTKEIIVISDGMIDPARMGLTKRSISDLMNQNIKIYFVQVLTSYEKNKIPHKLYNDLAQAAGEQVIVLSPDERVTIVLKEDEIDTSSFEPTPVIVTNSNHFITRCINITASVTMYNNVTPKLGSDLLVTTTIGKPILTTWTFGLGNVVAFTTDNGGDSTSGIYMGENSYLISKMVDWVVSDTTDIINLQNQTYIQTIAVNNQTPIMTTLKEKGIPGFDIVLIMMILSVIYMFRKR